MSKEFVAVVLVLIAGLLHEEPAKPERGRELKVPFGILGGGRLVVRLRPPSPLIMPKPRRDEHLHLVLPTETVRIDSLAKLRGRVQIRSPEEALAFCHLLTSPGTWYLWRGRGGAEFEIISQTHVDINFVFGNESLLAVYSNGHRRHRYSGLCGVIRPDKDLSEFGVKAAEARVTAEGYEVRRTLLVDVSLFDSQVLGEPPARMASVVELVSSDGQYVRKEHVVSPLPHVEGVEWRRPLPF